MPGASWDQGLETRDQFPVYCLLVTFARPWHAICSKAIYWTVAIDESEGMDEEEDVTLNLSRSAWTLLSLLHRESVEGVAVPSHLASACAELWSYNLITREGGKVSITEKGHLALSENGKLR